MSSAQDMGLLRRELEVVFREMTELRRLSTKPVVNAAVTGWTEALSAMAQPVSKPRLEDRRAVKPEPSVPGRYVDDWMGLHPRRVQWDTQSSLPRLAGSTKRASGCSVSQRFSRTTVCICTALSCGARPNWSKIDPEEELETMASNPADSCA